MVDLPPVPGVTHRIVEVAGARGPVVLHLAEAGAGEPVVLLHGWPQHWYCWRHLVGRLSGRYRLLMPDLRGFGWSAAPGYGYDPHTFATDLLAVLDTLGLDRVSLVGHDWGGFTALLVGIARPERVRRIVVFDAPTPWPPLRPAVLGSLWRTWYVVAVASPTGARLVAGDRFVPWFLGLGGRRGLFDAEAAAIYADPLREPARARASSLLYRSYLRAAHDVFVAHRYRDTRLSVPTRLVFGADDFYIPRSFVAGHAAHAPAMSVELVPGCGHFLPEERPELAAARVADFLGG